jgi:hypothetical protein
MGAMVEASESVVGVCENEEGGDGEPAIEIKKSQITNNRNKEEKNMNNDRKVNVVSAIMTLLMVMIEVVEVIVVLVADTVDTMLIVINIFWKEGLKKA